MFRRLSCQLAVMASNRNKFVPHYWVQTAQAPRLPMGHQRFQRGFSSDGIWSQQVTPSLYERHDDPSRSWRGAYHTYQNIRMPSPKRQARKPEDATTSRKASRNERQMRETYSRNETGYGGSEKRPEARKNQSLPPEKSSIRDDRPGRKSRQESSFSMKRWYYPHSLQQRSYTDGTNQDVYHYHRDRKAPIPSSFPGKMTKYDKIFKEDQRSEATSSAASDVSNDAGDIIYQFERSWEDIASPHGVPKGKRAITKQIRIVSYNILSQKLMDLNSYLYRKCNPDVLPWECRWAKLRSEIKDFDADVLCLQEVEESHYNDQISHFLHSLNYQCNYKRRTGNNANKPDGVLIAFKKQQFKVCEEKKVEYFRGNTSPVNQDNVAVITVLKPIFHESSHHGGCICFINTHLLYNPNRGDIKLAQLATLFSEVHNILSKYKKSKVPIILCGDFNSIPQSYLYNFITKEEIDCEGLEAKFVSGQRVSKGGRVNYVPSPLLPKHMKVSSNGCTRISQSCAEEDDMESHSKEQFKLRHSLGPLHSAYSHDKPEASTTQDKGVTVDFIFHSPYENTRGKLSLHPTKRLSLIHPSDLQKARGIPNVVHPSDHLPVVVDFALVQH